MKQTCLIPIHTNILLSLVIQSTLSVSLFAYFKIRILVKLRTHPCRGTSLHIIRFTGSNFNAYFKIKKFPTREVFNYFIIENKHFL
jgi:hypothetical protein